MARHGWRRMATSGANDRGRRRLGARRVVRRRRHAYARRELRRRLGMVGSRVDRTRRFVTVMLDPSITTIPGRAQPRRRVSRRACADHACCAGSSRAPSWSRRRGDVMRRRTPRTECIDDGVLLVGDAGVVRRSTVVVRSQESARVGMARVGRRAHRDGRRKHERCRRWNCSRVASGRCTTTCSNSPPLCHATRPVCMRRTTGQIGRRTRRCRARATSMSRRFASDPRIIAAFEELKRRESIQLRTSDALVIVDRPMVRGNRIVLEQHLSSPQLADPVRYCRSIDLVLMTRLASRHDQVPDLFDAYNRVAPPAALAGFPRGVVDADWTRNACLSLDTARVAPYPVGCVATHLALVTRASALSLVGDTKSCRVRCSR